MAKKFKLVKRPQRARQQYQELQRELVVQKTAVLKSAVKKRELVVKEWENTPTRFGYEINARIGSIRTAIYVVADKADQAGVTVWHLLSKGTDSRPAHMTSDFKSQTTPGIFSSRVKVGGVAYIDPTDPQPGIRPREWDEIANEETDEEMIEAIRVAGQIAGGKP